MDLSQIRAYTGLTASATPTNSNVSNDVKIGIDNAATSITSATKIVSFDALIVGAASDLVIDVSDLDSTGTTAWTAGTAQVETATAVGTIATSGNATVTVTAAGLTGSPLAVSVAVVATDTAATWAGKARTALAANADIAALFTVGGSSDNISLTRLPVFSHTFKGASVGAYPANDATLNIALANGTCTGITEDATSTDTTAGVISAGVYVPDLNGNDWEGNATGGATAVYGLFIRNSSTSSDSVTVTQGTVLVDYPLAVASVLQTCDATGSLSAADITIEPGTAGPALVEVTIVCS